LLGTRFFRNQPRPVFQPETGVLPRFACTAVASNDMARTSMKWLGDSDAENGITDIAMNPQAIHATRK
jgi:hypothetical protein